MTPAILARQRADVALEVPNQMTLIAEAALSRDLNGRHAGRQQPSRPVEANQRLKSMRWDTVAGAETRREMLRAEVGVAGGFGQRHPSHSIRANELSCGREPMTIRRQPASTHPSSSGQAANHATQPFLATHHVEQAVAGHDSCELASQEFVSTNCNADARMAAEARRGGIPAFLRYVDHQVVCGDPSIDRVFSRVRFPCIDHADRTGRNVG